jgi:hypothetical protein
MILVADPDELSPSDRELAELFGLSPAESRLAAALMTGSRLSDIAFASGVRITTLRTQLSSILRKVEVGPSGRSRPGALEHSGHRLVALRAHAAPQQERPDGPGDT